MSIVSTFVPPLTSGTATLTMSRVQSKNERESKKRILATMLATRNKYDMKSQVAIRGWLQSEQESLREKFNMVGKAEEEEQLDSRFQDELRKLNDQQKEKSLVLRGQLQKMEVTMKELSKGELNPSRPPMVPISTYGVDMPLYSQSLCSLLSSTSSSSSSKMEHNQQQENQNQNINIKTMKLPSVGSVASYICTSIIPNMCVTFEHPTVATGLGSLRSVEDLVSTATLIGEELMGPLLQGLHNNSSQDQSSSSFSSSSQISRDMSATTLSRVCWVESYKMLLGASSGTAGEPSGSPTLDEGVVFGSPLRPSTVHAGALDPTHVAPREEQLNRLRASTQSSSPSACHPPQFNGYNAKQRLLLLLETCSSNLVILIRSRKVKAAIESVYGGGDDGGAASSSLSGAASKGFALAAAPLLTIMMTSHVSHQSYTPPSSPHNPNPRAELLADLLWPYFEVGDAVIVGEIQGTVRCPTFESITPNMSASSSTASSTSNVGEKRARDGAEVESPDTNVTTTPINLLREASQGALLTSGARWLLQYVNSTINSAVLKEDDVDNTVGVDLDDRRNIAIGAVETVPSVGVSDGGASKLCYSKRVSGIPTTTTSTTGSNDVVDSGLVTSWRDRIINTRQGINGNSAPPSSGTTASSSGRVSYTLISDAWDETIISGCSRPAKMIRVKSSSVHSSPLGGATTTTTTTNTTLSPMHQKVVQLTSQFALSVLCAESTFARLWAYTITSGMPSQHPNWLRTSLFTGTNNDPSSSLSIVEHMWSNRQSFIQAKYFSGDATAPQRPPTTGPVSVFLHQLSAVDKFHRECFASVGGGGGGNTHQVLGFNATAPSAGGIPIALGQRYGSMVVGPIIESPFIQSFHSNHLPTILIQSSCPSLSAALMSSSSSSLQQLTSTQLEEALDPHRNYCCPASIVASSTVLHEEEEDGHNNNDATASTHHHWVANPVFRGFGMSSSEESQEEDDLLTQYATTTSTHSVGDLTSLRQEVRNLEEQHKRDNNDDAQEMLHRVMQTTSNSLMAQALNSNGADGGEDAMDITPPENVLFVCKLSPLTTAKGLSQIFSQFGSVLACDVITMPAGAREMTVAKQNYDAGSVSSGGGVVVGGQVRVNAEGKKSAKYAFVEFDTVDACNAAFSKMDGVMIDDTRIHVDFSQSTSNVLLQELQQQRAKTKAAAVAANINKKGSGGRGSATPSSTTTNTTSAPSNSDSLLGMLRGLPPSK